MKRKLKKTVEIPTKEEGRILLEWGAADRLTCQGFEFPSDGWKKEVYPARWDYSKHRCARAALLQDLSASRFLSFSVYVEGGRGGSFSLFFSTSEGAEEAGYQITLPIDRDGKNGYRIELPFLRAVGAPAGWHCVRSVRFDAVRFGQNNRLDTVLSFGKFSVYCQSAPTLSETLPELSDAAVFLPRGRFAAVHRRRVQISPDGRELCPLFDDGTLWLPIAPIAAVLGQCPAADLAQSTLSFTFRRHRYEFGNLRFLRVDGVSQYLETPPKEVEGNLFFPVGFLCRLFGFHFVYEDLCGLTVLSKHKLFLDPKKDENILRRLSAELTFERPCGKRLLADCRRASPIGSGRLLLSGTEFRALKNRAKTDPIFRGLLVRFRAETEAFFSREREEPEAQLSAAKHLCHLALLYRLFGGKTYAERIQKEANALAEMEKWGQDEQTVSQVSLYVSLTFDWCRRGWSEGRRATVERAVHRNGLRAASAYYDGKSRTENPASAESAVLAAGFLAATLATADVYPETAGKLLPLLLRNAEIFAAECSPDGGLAEGQNAFRKGASSLALILLLLRRASGKDYGFSLASGLSELPFFACHTATENGAWNYHGTEENGSEPFPLLLLAVAFQSPHLCAWRKRELLEKNAAPNLFDLLFWERAEALHPQPSPLPTDALFPHTGVAVLRSDWGKSATVIGLRGGQNDGFEGGLDAGSFFLEIDGVRFFEEPHGEKAFPLFFRRRAEAANTLRLNPHDRLSPDQTVGAVSPFLSFGSTHEKAFAVMNTTVSNPGFRKAKRCILLSENRRVATVTDEVCTDQRSVLLWGAYTKAAVTLCKDRKWAILRKNGVKVYCKVGGSRKTAFQLQKAESTDWTYLFVKSDVEKTATISVSVSSDRSLLHRPKPLKDL